MRSVDCSEVQARFNDVARQKRLSLQQHEKKAMVLWVHDFPFPYALQETDNSTISAMDVPGHIVVSIMVWDIDE